MLGIGRIQLWFVDSLTPTTESHFHRGVQPLRPFVTLDFLGVERSFQELDKTGCSCRDQIHRYGITACSNVTAAEVCCDDPLISRRVLHTTEPVTVIISDGLELNAARAESALADVVHVRHVDQQ